MIKINKSPKSMVSKLIVISRNHFSLLLVDWRLQVYSFIFLDNGDAYCFNTKMIRLKVSNLEDIVAS